MRKFFNVPFYAAHPSARGHVHITSADDVFAPPDFQPRYLEPWEFTFLACDHSLSTNHRRADKELFIWGYKKTREYARRMKCYRGEYAPYHPSFPEGSDATCKEDTMPIPVDAPDIAYSKDDDDAIWKYLQAHCKCL